MAGIFSIDSRILSDLSAESATKFFRDLLWCEARRVGLSPHRVVISLKTNVADGGIDARIDGSPTTDSVLTKGLTYFQIKAGHAFKPWLTGALKEELFGSSVARPRRDSLAPEIRECLRNRGRYMLVSFGHDLTLQQQSVAKKTLTKLLRACGYRKPAVEILGQGQLIGLFSLFPSLALGILGKQNLSFLTVDEWKARADMVQPLQVSDDQRHIIERIQHGLRGRGEILSRIKILPPDASCLFPVFLYPPAAAQVDVGAVDVARLFGEQRADDGNGIVGDAVRFRRRAGGS